MVPIKKQSSKSDQGVDPILEAILKYHNLTSAVSAIFQTCSELLGTSSIYLFIQEENAQPEILAYCDQTITSLSEVDLPTIVRALCTQAKTNDCTLYENNLRPESQAAPSPTTQINNLLITPLYIDKAKVGLLGLANKPGEFNDEDARLARAFAELASIALHNSRTLQSLEISEERYQELFESIPVGIYRTTPDGQFLEANPALVQILGYPDRESLLACCVEQMYANPAERGQFLNLAESASGMHHTQVQLRRWDGSPFWAFVSIRAAYAPDGQVWSYTGSVEDITLEMEMEREQTQSHEALEERNRQLQALNRAALVFGSTLDLDQLLFSVLDATLALLEVTATSVWLLDEQSQELACRQATGPAHELLYGWKLPVGQGLVGWVAQHNQSLIVDDAQNDQRHYTTVDEQTGFAMRSILSVPLRVRERLIGVLQAVDPQPGRFDESQLAFLESLATFAAVAIDNALLSEQAQQEITSRQWVERALQWELDVNIALAELSHVLLSPDFSIQQITNLTLDYARELTGSEHGFVSVIDPKTGDNLAYTLTKMIADGRYEITGENQRITFPCSPDGRYTGLWGYALDTRQAFFTNKPADHPASSGIPQEHVPLQNFLAFPALIGDQPVGEIALANNPSGYTEHHLEAIRGLADIFALAIQRLQAEQALRQAEGKYRLLFSEMMNGCALHEIICDSQGNAVDYTTLEVNQAFETLLNAQSDAVIGRKASEILPPEELQHWLGIFGPVALTGQSTHYEMYSSLNQKHFEGAAYCPEKGKFAVIFLDVTERKQAEQALRESENKFRTLYDSMTEGVSLHEMIYDVAGKMIDYRILDINPAYETILGITRQQAVGALASQVYGGEPPFLQLYAGVVENGKPASLDLYYLEIDKHLHVEVFSTAKGQSATVFTDISHKKAAEREIEQRNRELLTLFRISQFALAEQQIDALYQHIAAEISDTTGFPIVAIEEYDAARQVMVFRGAVGIDIPAGQMLEVPVDQTPSGQAARSGQMLVETSAEEFAGQVDERLRPLNVKTFLCFPMVAGQQSIGVISLAHPLKVPVEERLLHWANSLANYTAAVVQRQESALALERHARQLEALNAIAIAAQSAYSLPETLQLVLQKTLEITGMDGGWLHLVDADGENLSLAAHASVSPATIQEIQKTSIHRRLTGRIARSNSTILISYAPADLTISAEITQREGRITVTGTPIRVKDKLLASFALFSRSPRTLTQHDATLLTAIGNQVGLIIENTHLAEEAAEVAILRQVDRLRSELLANVSHEIRTPLGLIKIFATTLLRPDVSVDAQTLQEFLGNIDEETTKLEEIVDNLLLSSRLEAGSRQLALQTVDLNELVRTVSQNMATYGAWHHIELELPEQPLQAAVDAVALEQVLRNLINNAVKYSPEGSTIIIGMRPESGQAVVWVHDFGIGIPAEEVGRIFERFYRVDNTITRQVRGVGLGLPISQKLIELHGGRMWIESQPGNGSTFYFSLPL